MNVFWGLYMKLIELQNLVKTIGCHAAAARLGVSPRTVRRYLAGESRPRADLAALLRVEARLALGWLDALGGGWPGWRLAADGRLYAPDLRDGFAPGDLYALHPLRQQVRGLAADLAACRALCATLQDQPRTVSVPHLVTLSCRR